MKVALSCAVLAIAALSGCAAPPPPASEPAPSAAAEARPVASNETITGSRIPSRRTEKMVGVIGAMDYKENKESLPAPLQSH